MRPKIIIGITLPGLRPSILALAAAAACLLGGCAKTEVVGSSRTVHVALNEYQVKPQNIRAPAGVLTIYVRNYGRLTHNLVITRNGVTAGSTPPLQPGQSAALALDLTPGNYSMASSILSDQALGAYGNLIITG